jgi:hypothetical protein
MQFKAFEPGIEVSGTSIRAIVDAFRLFPAIALNVLVRQGIGRVGPERDVIIDTDRWYPQPAWLAAFQSVAAAGGADLLFETGRRIPLHVEFPKNMHDIVEAVGAIDVAYHMNHRKDGCVMYDSKKGSMLEGIGHYGCKGSINDRRIVSVCENPYPCDFDRGIIASVARQFEPRSVTKHEPDAPCRKRGDSSCTYVVTW